MTTIFWLSQFDVWTRRENILEARNYSSLENTLTRIIPPLYMVSEGKIDGLELNMVKTISITTIISIVSAKCFS